MGSFAADMLTANEQELAGLLQRFAWLIADCEIDPRRLAAVLGIDTLAMFRLDVSRPPGEELERAMRRFVDMMDYASLVFGSREDAGTWLRSPNPMLIGQRSPMDLMVSSPCMLREIRDMLKEQCELANLLP